MAVGSIGLINRLQRFGAVGAVGFAVDAIVLSALIFSGVDPFTSRIGSMLIATAVTWRLNRTFTFGASNTDQASEGARYVGVAVVSALVNYAIYAGIIIAFPKLFPPLALFVSTGLSMWVSYIGYARLAFRTSQPVRQGGTVFDPYSGVEELDILADAHNYNRALTDFVQTELPDDATVLDFGAGIGSFSKPIKQLAKQMICLEPDAHLRERLRDAGLRTVKSPDDIKTNTVDYGFTLNVLEHIEDDEKAMADLFRMIKPGGKLAVYVPALSWLYTGMDLKVGHWRRYGRKELIQKLERAGFVVTSSRYADSLGVPATLAYKLLDDGKGDVSAKSISLYDRYAFPLSRLLDRLTFGQVIGKNLAVYAVRPFTPSNREELEQAA